MIKPLNSALSNNNRLKYKKFSLVELMVVILVILLILSFFLPVLKGLRSKSYELICKNNYKQIGGLTLMYTSDYDGRLPGAWKKPFAYPKEISLTEGFEGKLATYLMP